MKNNSFEIKYNSNLITYEPSTGIIRKNNNNEIFRIYKDKKSQFPYYNNISSHVLQEHFKPFCLTIYLTNRCNLICNYCYAEDKEVSITTKLDDSLIHSVAEFIAKNCVQKKMPFILGFHGGNEPLLNRSKMEPYINFCQEITKRYGVELILTCTTNGVISPEIAQWAADTFSAITLSWDGPPDIQDYWRRTKDGTATSSNVIKSAKIFSNKSNKLKQFRIRATVNNESAHRLLEITQYFHQHNVRWIEFFPIYQNMSTTLQQYLVPETEIYIKNFLLAKKWAAKNGMVIGYAGSRINEFHDKFCPVYQHNLTITPDGYLTACFLVTHNTQNESYQYLYSNSKKSHQVEIDWKKLELIFYKLNKSPLQCKDCFNSLHCAKGCPSICPIEKSANFTNSFDCRLFKWMGLANILIATGYDFTEAELSNCEDFFSNIQIRKIEIEHICA